MKTKPIGVRFEEEDLSFVMKREGLKSAQQAVYFLFSEYCKTYRDKAVSKLSEVDDEYFPQPLKPITAFDNYLAAIKTTTMISQIEAIIKEIKRDPNLLPSQKLGLQQQAQEHSKDFYNE